MLTKILLKYLTALLLFVHLTGYGQLTIQVAKDSSRKYHIASYSYHEQFIGHKTYGAPVILTLDGGAAIFGDGDEGAMLVKLDKNGKQQWKRTLPPKGNEMESQSAAQDKYGNFYVFMLVYDETKYRGGCERLAFLSKTGTVTWDKFIGTCDLLNNPTVSYIRSLTDGRISMRGHMVKQKPPPGQDPTYLFWEGWINNKGILTQKTGAVIDWNKQEEWQSRLKPE